jgi:ribosome-interacting GTPase 1
MPTNLPPECDAIAKRLREAKTTAEKIPLLEELISSIPKHKGTDHLRADLRRKLSELKAESQSKKGARRRDSAFRIDREGAGQVLVIGPTNVGKSALVATLTNASPEVSDTPFTTWTPTPGMLPIEDIQVQLVDTPPLERDYLDPEMLDLIRRADLLLLVVDVQTDPMGQLEATLALLDENDVAPLDAGGDPAGDGRKVRKPLLIVANKADDEAADELFALFCELVAPGWSIVPVSAVARRNLDCLKRAVFERLEVIRVYSKPQGKAPDLKQPFVLKRGATVGQFAEKVHRDFAEKLTAARVWGSAEFDGQMVQRDHVLHDKDVVELRI